MSVELLTGTDAFGRLLDPIAVSDDYICNVQRLLDAGELVHRAEDGDILLEFDVSALAYAVYRPSTKQRGFREHWTVSKTDAAALGAASVRWTDKVRKELAEKRAGK